MRGGLKNHGGARRGAGRPRKWQFEQILEIGGRCEDQWREAVKAAREAELKKLFVEKSDLQSVWDSAQTVPLGERQQWSKSEPAELLQGDVEEELRDLTGALGGDGSPPRTIFLMVKPPRGTRRRIIAQMANSLALSESQVDNLWQQFRRLRNNL